MKSPPMPVRETGAPAEGARSSAQMNAGPGAEGTPDRTWIAELLRPLLVLRGRWSH